MRGEPQEAAFAQGVVLAWENNLSEATTGPLDPIFSQEPYFST